MQIITKQELSQIEEIVVDTNDATMNIRVSDDKKKLIIESLINGEVVDSNFSELDERLRHLESLFVLQNAQLDKIFKLLTKLSKNE